MVIVAAVDRSERAPSVVSTADELARAFDDDLHVVHVMSRSEFIDLEESAVDRTGTVIPMEDVKALAVEFVDDVIDSPDVEYTPVGLVGDAPRQIVEYAQREDARYVVVGPRRRSPTGKVIFGSAAQAVLLDAPCPVVTVIDREG